MKKWQRVVGVVAAVLTVSAFSGAADFCAYYTKINSGEGFEKYSRTSEYADITVNLNENGRLIFWRGSSYLPYWQTQNGKWYLPEVIPRRGDGPAERPDNVNTYSHVEIIESNPARVLVRWRYIASFDDSYDISPDDWADEYFIVYPDGLVVRTVQHAEGPIENWRDPKVSLRISALKLAPDGISALPSSWAAVPDLSLLSGSAAHCERRGFSACRGTYVLKSKRNGMPQRLTFSLGASELNPAVLVENWGDGDVTVTSRNIAGYRVGYEHTFDGTNLILWLERSSPEPLQVTLAPGEIRMPENEAPRVCAGEDQSLLVAEDSSGPYEFHVCGSYEDDGLPESRMSAVWEKVSGPGGVTFSDPTNLGTDVRVPDDGLYVLRLTVNDSELTGSDELRVVVDKDPGCYGSPVASWRFNESAGAKAKDSASGIEDAVEGYFERPQGVVGNCIRFNEFDTHIRRSASNAPAINSSEFTVEAWVAPRSYPWNWCPIVSQKGEDSGFYFGVDAHSRFGLWVHAGGNWQRCETDPPWPGYSAVFDEEVPTNPPNITLPLLKWSHIVGKFDGRDGITLYLNGERIKSLRFNGDMSKADADLIIGRETEKRLPANTERPRFTDEIIYSFDGLMDEIKIYNSCLSAEEVRGAYNRAQPKVAQPLEFKSVPKGPPGPGRFGVHHTTLTFDEPFDRRFRVSEHADKVLLFDEYDFKTVWWHGIAYYPIQYAANGIGMQHEAVETHGALGCEEALMDKQCRYAKARVIENTDARAVVEFRSASNDLRYRITHKQPTGWGCWSDDLWTVYPDGTVARRVTLWCSEIDNWHSYEQENYVIPPGLRPVDILELEANTIVNLDGGASDLNWKSGWPEGKEISMGAVKTYNIKANAWPFAITIPGLQDICNADNEDTPLEGTRRPYPRCFAWWDHWPIEQIPSDGKQLHMVNGHFSSSCTGAVIMDTLDNYELKKRPEVRGTESSITIPFMFGMTHREHSAAETALKLLPLAKMYNNPPALTDARGCTSQGYNRFKHEYKVRANSDTISFRLEGSADSPIVDPCFVVKDWSGGEKAGLELNGRSVPKGKDFRQGVVRDTDGKQMLVVWIKAESERPMEISISKIGG